jgi:carbonic anhydrase/acetyltransferase-like protein (isoleucine patch superfamily)
MITPLGDHTPTIGNNVFIAPDAWVIGDVELEEEISIFFGAVLRGDLLPIRVGARTNVQEHSVLHTSHGRSPTIVGSDVTIGHRAIIHGCTVEDCSLIGMGAIVLDDAVVGEQCLIGAGSVVTEGKKIPPRSLVIGTPAKVIRTLDDAEVTKLQESADAYVKTGARYLTAGLSLTRS